MIEWIRADIYHGFDDSILTQNCVFLILCLAEQS
jgi:hypothetical protein